MQKSPFLLTLILLASCGMLQDQRADFITGFVEELKANEVSVEMLQSGYFVDEKYKLSDKNYGMGLLTLTSLKGEIDKHPAFEVIALQQAIDRGLDVYQVSEEQREDVYLILLKDENGAVVSKLYCLMKRDKIYSLGILRKGNVIIGWN